MAKEIKVEKSFFNEFFGKYWRYIMYLCIAILMVCGFIGGCTALNEKFGMKDDNIIEESIENLVEDKTGIVIDFSPYSPED